MQKFISIGYTGLSIGEFMTHLKDHDAQVLVDVRLSPRSRVMPYNGNRLRETSARYGVRYMHLPQWGNRNYRGDHGDAVILSDYEAGAKVIDSLREEYDRIAIMCMCPNHGHCHRSDALEKYIGQNAETNPIDMVILRQDKNGGGRKSGLALESSHIQDELF